MYIRGKAWVFGNGVNTDQITPGRFLFSHPSEAAPHTLGNLNPDFASQVIPGDIVVAGRGFGCGSSREIAAQVFKHLGVGCLLAESFARTFYRNSVALGLPALIVEGITSLVFEKNEVEVNLQNGEIKNLTKGTSIAVAPLPRDMGVVVEQGGIEEVLRRMVKLEKTRK